MRTFKNSYKVFFLFVGFMVISAQSTTLAQERLLVSAFPGFNVINSDYVTGVSDEKRLRWGIGGRIALQRSLNGVPLEISVGFTHSRSTVFESDIRIGTMQNYSIDLRYNTIPVELLWVNRVTDRVEFSAGINVTPQYRSILLDSEQINLQDDRLLSFGAGLSGRTSLILSRFDSGNGAVYGNLSIRWTEFLFHNSRNRNTDDFSFRHLVITPQVGVVYYLD